jgi:hypothetical protein
MGCDIYSFDFKINHISRHIQLPQPPILGPAARLLPPSEQLPPLLIFNIQLPMYPVSRSLPCMFLYHTRGRMWFQERMLVVIIMSPMSIDTWIHLKVTM